MSISETQFRVVVGVAGALLVAGIAQVSFCGSVALPAKPPPPSNPTGTSSELLTRSVASPAVYEDFLERDAAAAGVRTPTRAELSRKLTYRVDDVRHVLEVGAPLLEVAGVRLQLLHVQEGLALEVTNATGAEIAYNVMTAPIPAVRCNGVTARPFNAMTIAKDGSETRIECVWVAGIALAVTRVETLEVPPLSAWYLDHVPPSAVGIEPRIARGHVSPTGMDRCSFGLPQALRNGLERGEIGWRDLVDFYARHRCQTYQFPLSYRAFRYDSERSIPAVSAGM